MPEIHLAALWAPNAEPRLPNAAERAGPVLVRYLLRRSLDSERSSSCDLKTSSLLFVTWHASADLSEKHMILENSEFKIVCDDCGSLTIKPIDPAHAASETKIQCGRCNAVRGTLAGLRALAHQGKDLFEF